MDKETVIKYKDVFEHWLQGGEVQDRTIGSCMDWKYTVYPSWNAFLEYRIKPREPRVWWAVEYKHSIGNLYSSPTGLDGRLSKGDRVIKVVEVIE